MREGGTDSSASQRKEVTGVLRKSVSSQRGTARRLRRGRGGASAKEGWQRAGEDQGSGGEPEQKRRSEPPRGRRRSYQGHAEVSGFPERDGKPREDSKQGSDLIRLLTDPHPCYMKWVQMEGKQGKKQGPHLRSRE